ncbi:MAG: heme ABC exporter, ATP-binding protein CcmA [Chloroflexi bacterium RBG_16_51_9]|nr:MAG: heme ABC exporter, ATP-binding protein CcmA [Chloroflexi bacterium RBG_16_51_9]
MASREANVASRTVAVKVEGLTKSFGTRLTLRGIDLEINQGESVVIFGPNGAGKTTLLKVLATIMNPSSGKVIIAGLDTKESAEEARHLIGIVSHNTFLYGNLTAYENLDFYSRLYDVPVRQKRIHEVVEMVGMTPRLHNRVATLSRGMQQRLSIARSLLHKPSIILLDEPETGLDRQANAMLWEIFQAEGEQKRTIVLTTHNLERGLELAGRVLILDKGMIVYDGAKQGLDLPALERVYQSSTGTEL